MEKPRSTVIIVPSSYVFFGGQPRYSPVATPWAAGYYRCPLQVSWAFGVLVGAF